MVSETSFMHIVRPNVASPANSSIASPCKVKIHASANFQILEIVSKQILTPDKRVIGTLLGYRSDDGSEYEVRDVFMVPSSETGDSIAIDDHAHKTLFQLYKKAHPKEHVLGWFDGSKTINADTALIHDFFSKGSDRAYPYPAIYLNAKYLTENNEVTTPEISTYVGAAVGKLGVTSGKVGWNVSSSSYIFSPVPNEVVSGTASEKLALNALTDSQYSELPITVSATAADMSFLSSEIKSVTKTIDNLLYYINNASNSDSDIDLLRLLSNNLLDRPQYLTDMRELESHFRVHNQDVVMIEYLTKAVKEQIELIARLTASSEADRK